jgi:transposase
MARSLFWLSDEAWKTLEPHLPHGKPGKPRVDDRTVISGILHVLKTGCRWRDVPPAYGPPTTIYNRYNRWSQRRIWRRIFEKMAAVGPVPDELSIDTSHVAPGNVADITMAAPLLGAVARPKRLLADNAYDADSLRKWPKQRKVKAAVPSTASRRTPYPLDSRAYKRRNLIERMFCKLKNWRRIATRYDRYAQNYLSGLALAAIMIAWI